jgi:ABC-type transport system involved in cytochrome c biogenesis permease subunit
LNLLDLTLARLAALLYLITVVLLGLEGLLAKPYLKIPRRIVLVVGFLLHSAVLVTRGAISGEVPFTDVFEYVVFLGWALVLAYLVFFRKHLPLVGALAVFVVVFLLLGSASYLFYTDPAGGTMPALRSNWLYIHVSLAALGETFFAVGFVTSLIYIVRRNRISQESLRSLDELTYRAISMGFPLFTAGAMVAGAIWAKQAWGAYWSWDPKEVLSLVVWLVYAAYLHARLVRGLRGMAVAIISVLGFLLTVFTIFGTLAFGGLHSYG